MPRASRTTAARWRGIVNARHSPRDAQQIPKAHSLPPEPVERVALFIDGANLRAASRTLGLEVDYKALLTYFRQRSYLVRAYYYTALLETDEYSPVRPLVDWLDYNWTSPRGVEG